MVKRNWNGKITSKINTAKIIGYQLICLIKNRVYSQNYFIIHLDTLIGIKCLFDISLLII